jgi:hypothetical protein
MIIAIGEISDKVFKENDVILDEIEGKHQRFHQANLLLH